MFKVVKVETFLVGRLVLHPFVVQPRVQVPYCIVWGWDYKMYDRWGVGSATSPLSTKSGLRAISCTVVQLVKHVPSSTNV